MNPFPGLKAILKRTDRWALPAMLACTLAWPLALSATTTDVSRNCNPSEYQSHLLQLQQLVESCRAGLTSGLADRCKPESVGPDDLVARAEGQRLVEYEWLRATLSKAAASSEKTDQKQPRTNAISIRDLDAAAQRLQDDVSVGVALDSLDGGLHAGHSGKPSLAPAQKTLKAVLAASEFHRVTAPSPFDRALQRAFEWLDRKLQAMDGAGAPSKGFVRLIVFGSVLVGLTLLAWWYVRALRRQHIRTTASSSGAHPQAASSIDWRERMQQAQALAALGEWRQAVHQTYWAAISRLEARGNWPADRSRTPREYLLLLPATHGKRADLLSLTRSFERIWYGHREARQKDFEDARTLLERIGNE